MNKVINGELKDAVALDGSSIVIPVDIQGVNTPSDEAITVTRRNQVTQYLQGTNLGAGSAELFNHEATGLDIGIAVRWTQATDFTVELGYIVPGTTNTIMIPYQEILSATASDNAGDRFQVKSRDARLRIRNTGTAAADIESVTIVDF